MTYLELYEKASRDLEHYNITLGEFEERIKPLKQEVRKTGHWIEREIEDTMRWKECSECHSEYPNMSGLKYCPNCGAKMEKLMGR